MRKDTAIIHHSAIPYLRPQAQEIVRSHLNNPNIRQPGSYHYVIECVPDGLVVQLHDEEYIGYHAGNYKYNPRSIGICLAGNFTMQSPTPAQLASLTKLLADIQARWGIPDENIKLHREVRLQPTACPGIDLRQIYFEKRQELLQMKLTRYKHEEEAATGKRKNRLTRIVERILRAMS